MGSSTATDVRSRKELGGRRIQASLVLVGTASFWVGLGLLVLNDHLLKGLWPGPATGKISDAAGLVMFPLLVAGIAVYLWPTMEAAETAAVSAVVVVVAFVALNTSVLTDDVYESVMTVVRDAIGRPLGRPIGTRRVTNTMDASDLLAVPFAAVGSIEVALRSRRVRSR